MSNFAIYFKSFRLDLSTVKGFLLSRTFWLHLALIAVFFVVCVLLTLAWLGMYTQHSQAIELPDYTGLQYEQAALSAAESSFRMEILDSIYVVGKKGHTIVQQEPISGSLVKENRTVYVTIAKKNADKVPVGRLPILYGKDFERKKRELYQSYQIKSRIVGRRFDPGEPDHILEVRYNDQVVADGKGRKEDILIDVGATLDFIVSERLGGELAIPDLVCMSFAEARFIIENSEIQLGEVLTSGKIPNLDSAYVTGQVPDPGEGVMFMGDNIRLSLSAEKPFNCK